MNVSDLLNPLTTSKSGLRPRSVSTPLLHRYQPHVEEHALGKSRSRFSEYEDNVIREGVAQGLTWGQISELLPHRKRATCFNRYRTLQGVRKSRKPTTTTIPSVSELNSEISFSSSDDDDDDSSYSPPFTTITTTCSSSSSISSRPSHRFNRSLPSHTSPPLYRRYSAFHPL